MKWQAKVAAQQVLSVTPRAHHVAAAARRYVTRSTGLDDEQYRDRVRWGAIPYVKALTDQHGRDGLEQVRHYDAGCGWQPTVPFLFHAAGVGRQRLADVEPHLTRRGCELIDAAMQRNREWLGEALGGPLTRGAGSTRGSMADILCQRGMHYAVPEGVTDATLPAQSVDIATCSGVLAYLDRADVDRALENLRRLIRPGGLIGLYVHLTDDFATTDPSIGRFNFLRFDERTWRRLCSASYFNNRLRFDDYLDRFAEHGLEPVTIKAQEPTVADLEALEALDLSPEFRGRPLDRLGIRRFVAVLRDKGSQ